MDVVKKEVMKLLTSRIIYPISNSQWISPVQIVLKKSKMTVMKNRHRCWCRLRFRIAGESVTCKDHFPLPFIHQVLERLAGKSHYCFLDGFSGYMQIHIALVDQHKDYPHLPIWYIRLYKDGIWLVQRSKYISEDLLEDCMEVFMDDFTVYDESFETCLENLSHVLTRCIETNLVLNFEKCHFTVTEGNVLGHLVSNRGIEVDKAKVDIIISLSNLPSVRKVRLFIGHGGFYKRFIKNFSKIALPLSKLLQKDVDFVLDQPCMEAFQELKKRLTSTPILQAPNLEYPFELMCDASNSTLRAVLGQQVGKQSHAIAYASRTMDPA
ncbi:Retrovirus-related Pol polyprotein from transposon opus, partial [Mucuna pruriens]